MSEQNLKRKSENDFHDTILSKRTARDDDFDTQTEHVDIQDQEELIGNEGDEEEIEEEDGIEGENFGYSEVEDDFSDEDELNPTTVDLLNDNDLSFSENEITEERYQASSSKKSNSKDGQPKVKKKRKKKNANMRKNIRNVLAEKQLDSATQKLREKELERLKRLGYATSPILNPSASATTSTVTKPTKNKPSKSDVIYLSSSDEETTPDPKIGHSNNIKKKEVFVLSSDSDDDDAIDEENIGDHHSDLGKKNISNFIYRISIKDVFFLYFSKAFFELFCQHTLLYEGNSFLNFLIILDDFSFCKDSIQMTYSINLAKMEEFG